MPFLTGRKNFYRKFA